MTGAGLLGIGAGVATKSYEQANLGFDVPPSPALSRGGAFGLTVVAREGGELSPAQAEFNKLMKRLENTRVKHRREQARLDALLAICAGQLMPLLEDFHRLNFQLVHQVVDAMKVVKLTPRRRKWLGDLIHNKAAALVADSCGLTDDQVESMERVVEALRDPDHEQEMREREASELEYLRGMVEATTRDFGLEVDLSDLDPRGTREDFARQLQERLDAAAAAALMGRAPSSGGRPRKPTKAQIEKEKRLQETEEAKRRDLKSLYKQLAKVLHPDLETDPARRIQKDEWMKRLTAAHAGGDLRELLCIEMEWLGVEASNLVSATDEKLKVYCMVLKEQIADLKIQTEDLVNAPQYGALSRFRDPLFGYIPPPGIIKEEMQTEIGRLQKMLNILRQGGPACQKMIIGWADDHARAARNTPRPF